MLKLIKKNRRSDRNKITLVEGNSSKVMTVKIPDISYLRRIKKNKGVLFNSETEAQEFIASNADGDFSSVTVAGKRLFIPKALSPANGPS